MTKIEQIKDPKFLKKLNINECEDLAKSIRDFILDKVSKNGGHLSSNLGIVDLTIAMLKVFDVEKDIILFDVGHECYPYKILTGRSERFDTLRKFNGLSGFQSLNESKYDRYEAGHSSTSIGSGLGFAIARDLNKENHHVITVIGDGSISNGLAYEAINHLGDLKTKQIIILNDNQMSISENVGAMHNFLDEIRSGKKYNQVKKNTKKLLSGNKLGRFFSKILDNTKNNLKKIYLKNGSMFTDLGIEYYGPINGHDYVELLKYLDIAKRETKPVILHVITEKGKGYKLAEEDKIGKFHGIGAFDVETGEVKSKNNLPSYSEIISSYVYNFAKKDKDIICITPGMCYGSKLNIIKEKLPKQFIDVGIAEEHALVLANSLALAGKKSFVFIYSTFLQRGYDQIVHDIARMKTNVTICVDRAGLVPGDGVSHQGVFDIPMLLNVPNVIISMPMDAKEANNLIYTSLNNNGPFVIRYEKINIKYDYSKASLLKIGSWSKIKNGDDATIITYGSFVNKASDIIDEVGKDFGLVNARFIKPFDSEMFGEIVKLNKPIFVIEESMKIGSLASHLALEIQKYNTKSRIVSISINDEFLTHASRDELLNMTNLDNESIIKVIKDTLR